MTKDIHNLPLSTVANGKPEPLGPTYRIELLVSCTDPTTGTQTPLGRCDDQGRWAPLAIDVERASSELTITELAEWLFHLDLLGETAFDALEETVAAVAETRQRCLTGGQS